MNDADKLQKDNGVLREQLAAEKEKVKAEKYRRSHRDVQLAVLHEQIKQHLKNRFGTSSEKCSPDQVGLFKRLLKLAHFRRNNQPLKTARQYSR